MKYKRRVRVSTKMAAVLWGTLIIGGLVLAYQMLVAVIGAVTTMIYWLFMAAIVIGSVHVLYSRFETWADDRYERKQKEKPSWLD